MAIAAAHLETTGEPTYVYRREAEDDSPGIVRLSDRNDDDGAGWEEVPWRTASPRCGLAHLA